MWSQWSLIVSVHLSVILDYNAHHELKWKWHGLCGCTWIIVYLFLQGPGPSGKNEEKVQVLTEKIEDLVVQVCNTYGRIGNLEDTWTRTHCICHMPLPDYTAWVTTMEHLLSWNNIVWNDLIKHQTSFALTNINCVIKGWSDLSLCLDRGAGVRGPSGGGPGNDEAGGAAEGGKGAAQLHPLGESANSRLISLQMLLM